MTHTLKRYIPLAVLLILLVSLILVGCTQQQSGYQLDLVSQEHVFTVGDDNPDLTQIRFSLVDKSGKTLETVTATREMFSDAEWYKLINGKSHTITIVYNDKKLNVTVTFLKAPDPIIDYKVYFDCNEVYGANNTDKRGHFDESPLSILEAPEEYITGNKLVVLPLPYLDGFEFDGWYSDRLGTGTKLTIQNENPYLLGSATTTFYAQWKDRRNFEVRFVNQITSTEISRQTVVHGKSAILPSGFTLGGVYVYNNKNYIFKGWSAEGEASYTNVTQNLVVYATFEPQTVAVNFYKEDKKTIYRTFQIEYGGIFNKDDIPLVFFSGEYSQQSHTADWIDFSTESPLPDINITNITKEVKIYIRYTPKPMTLTFYKLTKAEYDTYGGGSIPSALKEVISISYGRTLATIPVPPLFTDDPATTDLDESKKYKAEWRIYNGDTHTAPNFNAAIVSDKEYFVMYTVYVNTVKFVGYGNDINKVCEYGERVIPPTISTVQYNPLVFAYSWHSNSDRDESNKFNFDTRITQPVTLYFKVAPKNINVYYCMPGYYSQSGAGVYDNPIDYEVNTSAKKIIIDGNAEYSIDYTVATVDYMSPIVNGAHSPAYALSQQTVAPGGGANRKSYVFHKYRQDTYINETTKWYDYKKTVWDFSGDYYTTLKNYMIANNVAYVVLYAALVTNEQVISYKNVSYTFGASNPIFEPIIYDNLLPLIVNYGESFDPNDYIRRHSITIPAPAIAGETITFTFAGWYTSPAYATGTKIQEGNSITIKSDTTFYAKWVDNDTGSDGLQFELASDGLSYRISGYISPAGGEDVLRIPLFYDGLTVSGINADIFDKSGTSIRNIKEVELRSSISNIAEGVFTALTGLTAISINGNNSDYYMVENGILYTADMSVLIKYPASKSDAAFTVPQSVTRIAKEAFALCSHLKQVDYQEGSALAHISQGAFWECDSLTTISLPISLQSIGANAFYEAAKLSAINLQAGTYTIQECGENAFGGTKWLANRNGQIILGNVLVMYREDTANPPASIIIDDAVSTVADGAFSQGAKTLSVRSITFGANSRIQRIGSLAFNAATELSAIYIRCAAFVDIQLNAFSGISMDATLYVDISKYGEYIAAYQNNTTQEMLLDIKEIRPLS